MFIWILLTQLAWAAPVLYVRPPDTEPSIRQINGPHVAMHPKRANAIPRLLITLGGTGSKPEDLFDFQVTAAEVGYHVIGIDYPNTVITTVCRDVNDPKCFEKFRSEIGLGMAISDFVQVDFDNCILRRVFRLLHYLEQKDPVGGWDSFVGENFVDWGRISVAGHSQGSGHAAFMAKMFPMDRVILLAGPQDVAQSGPASWLAVDGLTPASHFFGLLHSSDVFGSEWQLKAIRALIRDTNAGILNIDDDVPAQSNAQILISHLPVQNAHMAPVSKRMKKVWNWLLQRRK